ncbi:MAG: transporter substrate-binding domain-containing protein [Tatlockia sp.]|nr:transporter substrate-binding domain-containing protein [Tatlockia sp.]
MHELLNDPTRLNICSYQEFEPIIYGQGQGFEADILRAVAHLWNVDIVFHSQKIYENIWEMPEKLHFDLAAGGITPQKDRKEHAIYSTPTAFYSQSLLIRNKDYREGRVIGYESFKNNNLVIGVVKKSAGEKFGHLRARECGLKIDIFKQYTSESELLPALINEEIAAIARGDIGNEYQASLNKKLITIAKKNYDEKICFAVDPNRQEFLIELNKAINIVTMSGELTYNEWRKNKEIFNKSFD